MNVKFRTLKKGVKNEGYDGVEIPDVQTEGDQVISLDTGAQSTGRQFYFNKMSVLFSLPVDFILYLSIFILNKTL